MSSLENEIAIVPSSEAALAVFTAENGLDPFLKKIREEIDLFCLSSCELDLSKESNRKKIASMAHKVARSKTALDDAGMALSAQLKDMPRKVDAERRRMREILDKWKEEVREPLAAWEAAERDRINKIQDKINDLKSLPLWKEGRFLIDPLDHITSSVQEIKTKIDIVKNVIIDESFGEFKEKAEAEKNKAIIFLHGQIEKRIAFESEQAEKQRLEEEARIESEKKAEAERVEREKQAEIERIAREKRIAEEAKRQAEEEAARKAKLEKEASERRELELRLTAEKAQREALEAQERARKAAVEAEERVRREAEEAARKQEEDRLKREEDEKNRKKVNEEIAFDFLPLLGFNKDSAQKVADELCSSSCRIRHVKVLY